MIFSFQIARALINFSEINFTSGHPKHTYNFRENTKINPGFYIRGRLFK